MYVSSESGTSIATATALLGVSRRRRGDSENLNMEAMLAERWFEEAEQKFE